MCVKELCVTMLCVKELCATERYVKDTGCRQVPRLPQKQPRRPRRHQSQPSAISATPATQSEGRCHQTPHLPRKVKVELSKCRTCHTKWTSMSASATPATQTALATTAPNGTQSRHQSQPSAMSPLPATQSESRCRQVPRLPQNGSAQWHQNGSP